jgi:hypothetical protein
MPKMFQRSVMQTKVEKMLIRQNRKRQLEAGIFKWSFALSVDRLVKEYAKNQ